MGKHIHRWIGGVALVILVIAFAGWRTLRGARAAAGALPAPVPSPQLAELIPYAAPIADTLHIAPAAGDTGTAPRDPFEGRALPRVVAASSDAPASAPAPKPAAEVWRVTTTLVAGTRRAALINDALVYVGDPLPGGARLTSVERDHVVVTDTKGAAHTVAVVKEGND